MTSYVEEMLKERLAQLDLDSPSRDMYEIALMRLNETPRETGSELISHQQCRGSVGNKNRKL